MGEINWEKLRELVEVDTTNKTRREEVTNYNKVRLAVRRRDGGCVVCGNTKKLHVHHIIPDGLSTEDNLVTLCRTCHQVVHGLLYVTGRHNHIFIPGKPQKF